MASKICSLQAHGLQDLRLSSRFTRLRGNFVSRKRFAVDSFRNSFHSHSHSSTTVRKGRRYSESFRVSAISWALCLPLMALTSVSVHGHPWKKSVKSVRRLRIRFSGLLTRCRTNRPVRTAFHSYHSTAIRPYRWTGSC